MNTRTLQYQILVLLLKPPQTFLTLYRYQILNATNAAGMPQSIINKHSGNDIIDLKLVMTKLSSQAGCDFNQSNRQQGK